MKFYNKYIAYNELYIYKAIFFPAKYYFERK